MSDFDGSVGSEGNVANHVRHELRGELLGWLFTIGLLAIFTSLLTLLVVTIGLHRVVLVPGFGSGLEFELEREVQETSLDKVHLDGTRHGCGESDISAR